MSVQCSFSMKTLLCFISWNRKKAAASDLCIHLNIGLSSENNGFFLSYLWLLLVKHFIQFFS